jgi:hypothetical protein
VVLADPCGTVPPVDNPEIADRLEAFAPLLELVDADPGLPPRHRDDPLAAGAEPEFLIRLQPRARELDVSLQPVIDPGIDLTDLTANYVLMNEAPPRADRQYPSQLAVAREPTGSVGRHQSSVPTMTVTTQYLARPLCRSAT